MDNFDELVTLLRGKDVRLQTHDFPDPDAIASVFALSWLLEQEGIPSVLCYCGKIDKINNRQMLEAFHIPMLVSSELPEAREDTCVVTVDGQKSNSNFTDIPGIEVACIDHHPWVTNYEYQVVDHRITGACATIVTMYYMRRKIVPPTDIATALLYGIKMDTQQFCNGVKAEDIQAFSYLHQYADQDKLMSLENNVMEIADLRAYGSAIQNIAIYGNIGFAHIPFDCPDGLIASVSSFILSLDAVEVSIIYVDRAGGLKFSVRSELLWMNAGKMINLSLREIGNGGGHQTMAGGMVYAERMYLLGTSVDEPIRERFLTVYQELKKEYENV